MLPSPPPLTPPSILNQRSSSLRALKCFCFLSHPPFLSFFLSPERRSWYLSVLSLVWQQGWEMRCATCLLHLRLMLPSASSDPLSGYPARAVLAPCCHVASYQRFGGLWRDATDPGRSNGTKVNLFCLQSSKQEEIKSESHGNLIIFSMQFPSLFVWVVLKKKKITTIKGHWVCDGPSILIT